MRPTKALWCIAAAALAAYSQTPAPPSAYTATVVNSMFGPEVTQTISRSGSKAVVENVTPASAGGTDHIQLLDLTAGTSLTWDAAQPGNGCGTARFSGDWGDPFEQAKGLNAELAGQHPKETGTATVNGFATKILEVAASPSSPFSAKVWVENKYGLIVKMEITQGNTPPKTILELKSLSIGPIPAAKFVAPASCSAAPPPSPDEQRYAAETGGSAADFASAIMAPKAKDSPCTVLMRFVKAGSMQPITSGFQIAIDKQYDLDHPASYTTPAGPGPGRVTFGGGHIHEETAAVRNGVLRIENAPDHFWVETSFGSAGSGATLIYRQCSAPETVLLVVVRNPARIGEGIDYLWAKSGKFAK